METRAGRRALMPHVPPSWPSELLENHRLRHSPPPGTSIQTPSPTDVPFPSEEALRASLASLSLSAGFRDEPPPYGGAVKRPEIAYPPTVDHGSFRARNFRFPCFRVDPRFLGSDYEGWDGDSGSYGLTPHSAIGLGEGGRASSSRREREEHQQHRQGMVEPCYLQGWDDLRGNIVRLAMDQNGCRFLQAQFNDLREDQIEMVFMEVIEHLCVLMVDPFGNYLFQRLLEVCSVEQRTRILLFVTRNECQFVALCLDMHGTRSVQKLLDHVTTRQQISLVMAVLSRGAVRLARDNNGHHVIKHCLKCFPYEDIQHLLNEMADNCFAIATDKSGCCVLQSCIEHSQGESRERLVVEIISNALPLTEDRYGNYVVQYLLGMKTPWIVTNISKQLRGSFVFLSCNKFASNVVEKCLQESRKEQFEKIVLELLRSSNASLLLNDPYGNYVIQTALSKSEGILSDALQHLVRVHCSSMRTNQYGKKVLAWFEKRKLQHVLTV